MDRDGLTQAPATPKSIETGSTPEAWDRVPVERSSLLISSLTAIQMMVAIGLQVLLGYLFGSGGELEAYFVAVALPQLVQLVTSGTFSVTVPPTFQQWCRTGDPDGPAGATLVVLGAIGLVGSLVVAGGARQVAALLGSGLVGTEEFEVAVSLTAALAPCVFAYILVAYLTALAVARKRHRLWPAVGVLSISVQVALTWALVEPLGIVSLAVGQLVGASLQIALLAVYVPRRLGECLAHLSLHWRFLVASAPVLLARSATRFTTVSDRWVASWLGAGAIAHVVFGTRLLAAITVVASTGLGTTLLPRLSELCALAHGRRFAAAVVDSVRLMAFVVLPGGLILVLWPDHVVRLVLERGAFSPEDTLHTAGVVACGAGCFVFACVGVGIVMALHALGAHGTVALVGTISSVVNIGLAYALSRPLGVAGISLSASLIAALNLGVMTWLLRQRTGVMLLRPWRRVLDPNLVSLAIMALLLVAGRVPLAVLHDHGLWYEFGVLSGVLVAALLYAGLALLLTSPELGVVLRALRWRVRTDGVGDDR